MLVKTFISHIKHKSINIQIFDSNACLFEGTIGEYATSLARNKCDNLSIRKVYPAKYGNKFHIICNDEVAEK